jgi:hypothetical protein
MVNVTMMVADGAHAHDEIPDVHLRTHIAVLMYTRAV